MLYLHPFVELFIYINMHKLPKYIILVTLLATTLCANSLEARTDDVQMSKAFLQHGIIMAERGDAQNAAYELSQALLLDPNNKTAEDYLVSLSSARNLPAKDRQTLYQITDLLKHRKNLESQISYLSTKRDSMTANVLRGGADRDMVEYQLARVGKETDWLGEESYSGVMDREKPLISVAQMLRHQTVSFEKRAEALSRQVNILHEMHQGKADMAMAPEVFDSVPEVKNIHSEEKISPLKVQNTMASEENALVSGFGVIHEKLYEIQKIVLERERQIRELTEKVDELNFQITNNRAQASDVEEEVSGFKDNLRDIQKKYEVSQRVIDSLEEELAEVKKSSHGSEAISQQVAAVNNQMMELQSRLDLNQKIIEEKNKSIQDLEVKLAQVEKTPSRHSKSSDPEKLEELILMYEENLDSARMMLERKDEEIKSLEAMAKGKAVISGGKHAAKKMNEMQDLLDETSQKLTKANKTLEDRTSQIVFLEERLTEKNTAEEIEGFNKFKLMREQAILQLNDTLGMYRMGLNDALAAVQQKDKVIAELTQQVTDLRHEVARAQNSAQNKDRQLESIKEALRQERAKLTMNDAPNDTVVLKTDNAELEESRGMLEIYRMKLGDASSRMVEAEKNAVSLEKELEFAQMKLVEKDALLEKTKENLTNLEQQMIEIQNRLLKIKKQTSPDSSEKEDDLDQLQSQIEKLQQYIQAEVQLLRVINTDLSLNK